MAAVARSTRCGSLGAGSSPSQETPRSLFRSEFAAELAGKRSNSESLDALIRVLWSSLSQSSQCNEGNKGSIKGSRGEDMSTETTQDVTISTSTGAGILLTDVAATKVSALLAQEGRDDLNLRVAVQPGGCSGLRYQLYFDDRALDGDTVTTFGTVKVVTDKMSTPYLMGASIDFVDTIEKQGFTIDNPNAQGSCACGDSFN